MGRPSIIVEVDQLERGMRNRNAICSSKLLAALQLNHGNGLIPITEPEPEPEPQPEPEPLAPAVIADLPIVLIATNKVEQIKRIVCKRYGISKANIETNCRKKGLVRPRQIAMYLARQCRTPQYSLPEIGRRFGGRDHTTVLHACRKIEYLIARDAELASQVAEIRAEIPV